MSQTRIVECVPNFSEGRDRSVIDRIAAAMAGTEGVTLLDVDRGAATNRTVMTIVGEPAAVRDAAFEGIKTAAQLIDMRRHQGEHPRQGATDVCPFIPVRGVSMEDCAVLARELGARVGAELGIAVYLYESAASRPERQNLATVRAGEYEGLEKKLSDPVWAPDYGPEVFNPRSGATAIGARKFLIAYNVNLNTRSRQVANEVAMEVREQGRNLRGADGKFVRGPDGEPKKRPGLLRHVKATGWVIEEYARAQVSCNLTDYEVSNLHDVFDACEEEARKIGARVTGSELIGLVPLDAMLRTGRHYLARMGRCTGVPQDQIIECAVQSLGLAEISPFDPRQRIIEYRIASRGGLVEQSLTAFVDETSSESPAPGGGSVAALCGSLGAALCSMVGNLTVGKRKMEAQWADCNRIAVTAQQLKDAFLADIDADTQAFQSLMAAFRLTADTPEDEARKASAVEEATRGAILVPFSMLERTPEVVALAAELLEKGNPNAASDAATGAVCAAACAAGAYFNVMINLKGYSGDQAWAQDLKERGRLIVDRVQREARGIGDRLLASFA
jgi:glutamate formiminotransferase/formiminotetrahydrofolate cyclodeaminase